MSIYPFGIVLLFAASSSQAVAQIPSTSTQSDAAEQFRHFLASKKALVHSTTIALAPAIEAYLREGVSPLPAYGIRRVLDNPPIARLNALNAFTVLYKHPADAFCAGSTMLNSCLMLADNCIVLGSSIFCDDAYLVRLYYITLSALSYSWDGVSDAIHGRTERVYLTTLRTLGLIDLARIQNATRLGQSPDLSKLEDFPSTFAFNLFAESNLFDVMLQVSYGLVLSHELAHIEQNLTRMTPKVNVDEHRRWAEFANYVTCRTSSAAADPELDADLRAVDIIRTVRENGLKLLTRLGLGFSPRLSPEFRGELDHLAPIERQVTMLAAVCSLEYLLLVHLDPEGGLDMLKGMPSASEKKMFAYLIRAGLESGKYAESGHIDPALRALFIVEALHSPEPTSSDEGAKVVSLEGYRLAPYILGRLQYIQHRQCGRSDDVFMPILLQYVLNVFKWTAEPPKSSYPIRYQFRTGSQ